MATFKQLIQDLRNAHEGRDNQLFYETLDKLSARLSHLDYAPNPPGSLTVAHGVHQCRHAAVKFSGVPECACEKTCALLGASK
jgi:hypothetical protein